MLPGLNAAALLGAGRVNIIGVAVQAGQTIHSRIDADGNSLSGAEYNFGGAYYSQHGAFALADEVIDGQNMVRVPALWYRRQTISTGPNSGKEAWWVADGPTAGFVLHPAFMKDDSPIPHFWMGKYQGVEDGVKLGSYGGKTPDVSRFIGQFQSRALARNVGGQSGWMMWSYYQLAVIQMLAMIESGSTDSQAAIGQGRVNMTSAANVDASDVAQATYRGVVGLWGNVYQMIDGVKTVSGVISLWDKIGHKGWVDTGQSRSLSGGTQTSMIGAFGEGYDFRDVFTPNAAHVSSGAWRDSVNLPASGSFTPIIGGLWNSGASAGLWFNNYNISTSSAATSYGTRLAKEP